MMLLAFPMNSLMDVAIHASAAAARIASPPSTTWHNVGAFNADPVSIAAPIRVQVTGSRL
jgi:hypothetical protein